MVTEVLDAPGATGPGDGPVPRSTASTRPAGRGGTCSAWSPPASTGARAWSTGRPARGTGSKAAGPPAPGPRERGGSRTARWVVDEVRSRAEVLPGDPTPASPGAARPRRPRRVDHGHGRRPEPLPRRDDYVRVGAELTEARAVLEAGGFLRPRLLPRGAAAARRARPHRGWALGTSYERLWWPSGFTPREARPGRAGGWGSRPTAPAPAWVLRHGTVTAPPLAGSASRFSAPARSS